MLLPEKFYTFMVEYIDTMKRRNIVIVNERNILK